MEVADSMIKDNEIPIVDLTHMGRVTSPVKPWVKKAAVKMERALTEKGLALVVNHGITEEKLQTVYRAMKKFCDLPAEVKEEYNIQQNNSQPTVDNHGYVAPGTERFVRDKSETVRHVYNILSLNKKLPDDLIPGFKDVVSFVADEFKRVASLVLQIMAVGLELEPNFFLKKHQKMLDEDNPTTFRMLHYPPMGDEARYVPGLLRCGEHTDYGSFSLLVQDSEGGLEVFSNGKWKRVGHLPGAILVNTGDLMQKWTDSRFISLKFRVVVPEQKTIRCRSRNSIAFFVHPENDTIIDPKETGQVVADQSDLDPPPKRELTLITAYQHLQQRLKESRLFRLLRALRKRIHRQRAVVESTEVSSQQN